MDIHYYTLSEIAKMLKVSPETVSRIIEDQPGVLDIGWKARRGKRGYRIFRVPEDVLQRILQKYRVK